MKGTVRLQKGQYMCARYFIRMEEHENDSLSEEVRRRYGSMIDALLPPDGIVKPTVLAPVRCRDRRGNPGIFLMHFGFKLNQSMVINARSESITVKPMFRPLVRERRCLIPANRYTEWQHDGKKRIPYEFESADSRLMFFAGLYRLEPGARFADFVILTRDAAPAFSSIHDRMPLILTPAEQQTWMNPAADIQDVLHAGRTDVTFSPAS